ncbi:MAG TPA: acyl-CoA dehydrogenase family protein [Myxococcota bacterium]|nr:acyl-CoA dehydrogenase family protein [Myxococcota bacterium]
MSLELDFDESERAIASAVARFCRDEGAEALARAGDAPFPRALWRGLGELGVFALAEPGSEGGAGGLAAAFEALGAAACPGPLVAQVFAVRALPERERAPLALGEAVAAVGAPPLVPFAPVADVFVELDGDGAWLARPRAPVAPLAGLGGEPLGRVALERVAPLAPVFEARALSDLARAAWSAGAGRRLLDVAVEHARARRQFGRAIGEFQAVAHPLADVHIRLSAAEGLVRAAAWALDAGAREAHERTAAARLAAERAGRRALHTAHQTLGALGATLEGPLFHLSRRLRQLAALPPDAAHAEAAVLAPLGLGG